MNAIPRPRGPERDADTRYTFILLDSQERPDNEVFVVQLFDRFGKRAEDGFIHINRLRGDMLSDIAESKNTCVLIGHGHAGGVSGYSPCDLLEGVIAKFPRTIIVACAQDIGAWLDPIAKKYGGIDGLRTIYQYDSPNRRVTYGPLLKNRVPEKLWNRAKHDKTEAKKFSEMRRVVKERFEEFKRKVIFMSDMVLNLSPSYNDASIWTSPNNDIAKRIYGAANATVMELQLEFVGVLKARLDTNAREPVEDLRELYVDVVAYCEHEVGRLLYRAENRPKPVTHCELFHIGDVAMRRTNIMSSLVLDFDETFWPLST